MRAWGKPSEPIVIVTASALPVFYGASGIKESVFLAAAVIVSVLVFEALYGVTKRLWFRSVRPLFALIVLSLVLNVLFLISGRSSPLTLASAFLLALPTMKGVRGFRARLVIWCGFFALIFSIGLCREWSGTFRMLPAAPFWIGGTALSLYFLFKRKTA